MKEELELKERRAIWLKDITNIFQELYDQYRAVEERNGYLEGELRRLKSEVYKDEELSKMKEEYDKMKKEYYLGFSISEKEDKKIKEWIKKQTEGQDLRAASGGAIGGRFHYEFIPTGVGTIGKIIDSLTGEKFTFQDIC